MSVITEPAEGLLERVREAAHPLCVVCGRAHESGLGLRFSLCEDGSVEADVECKPAFQGYDGVLHGGITSAILDGAMTNCLFARGIVAVTGEMTVRFRHPVELSAPLVVRGQVSRSRPPLHMVEATITQAGRVKAEATGKFIEQPSDSGAV